MKRRMRILLALLSCCTVAFSQVIVDNTYTSGNGGFEYDGAGNPLVGSPAAPGAWIAGDFITNKTSEASAVLYADDFSGSGAVDLNTTAPDVANTGTILGADHGTTANNWFGSESMKADGSKADLSYEYVSLDFNPKSGFIYDLILELNPNDGVAFLSVGFSELADTNPIYPWNLNSHAWALVKGNGDVQVWPGPNASGGGTTGTWPLPFKMRIELDTTVEDWVVRYYDETTVSTQLFQAVVGQLENDINYVTIGGEATGSVDNFELNVRSAPGGLSAVVAVDDVQSRTNALFPGEDDSRFLLVGQNGSGTEGLGAIQNTGYVVQEGDSFDLEFDWGEHTGWNASAEIRATLFTTSNDATNGIVSEIWSETFAKGILPGVRTRALVTLLDVAEAQAAHDGRELWIAFSMGSEVKGAYAEVDNVKLSVSQSITMFDALSFNETTQSGGNGSPIDMGGAVDATILPSPLTLGPGFDYHSSSFYVRSDADVGFGNYVSLGMFTTPGTNAAMAVAAGSYYEFTVVGDMDYDALEFSLMARRGDSNGYYGAVVRSSVDDYASDLGAVLGGGAVKNLCTVDLRDQSDLDSVDSVTFRIYLYDDYTNSVPVDYTMGIDDLRIAGRPTQSVLFATDFDSATTGGWGSPIDMNGTNHVDVSVTDLTVGAGLGSQYFGLRAGTSYDGTAATITLQESATTLAESVANNEYMEFTLTSAKPVDLKAIGFDFAKHSVTPGGVTLRSSLDGYTADLVTVGSSAAGGDIVPAVAIVSTNISYASVTSVTFRFYQYSDNDVNSSNLEFSQGIDNIVVVGQFGAVPLAGLMSISVESGTMTVSAENLTFTASHQLQSSLNLVMGPWTDVGAPTSGVVEASWTLPATETAAFFKVESSK